MFLEEKFLAFAHRGGNEFAPENSFRAFKSAVDIGYKYLETDVHLTKDGFLIAFHDDTLDRVTDKSGLIRDLTLSEIKKQKLPEPMRFLCSQSCLTRLLIVFLILIVR